MGGIKDFVKALNGYASRPMSDREKKRFANESFPYSSDPTFTLHQCNCFAEDLLKALGMEEVDSLWESIYSYVVCNIETLIGQDWFGRPYTGEDYIAKDMRKLLPEAANEADIPVIEVSRGFFNNEQPSYRDVANWNSFLQGKAIGDWERGGYVFCSILDPYNGTMNLLDVFSNQIEHAAESGELSGFGRAIQPFMRDDEYQHIIASGFARGIEWVIGNLIENGRSPARYFARKRYLLPPVQRGQISKNDFNCKCYRRFPCEGVVLSEGVVLKALYREKPALGYSVTTLPDPENGSVLPRL